MEKFGEKNDETPFTEPLQKSNFNEYGDKLKELEHHPNKIIRMEYLDNIAEMLMVKEKTLSSVELTVEANKIFRELNDIYHINVLVDFVVGKNKGNNVLYIVTDRVNGISLNALEYFSFNEREKDKLLQETDELYAYLI